MATQTKAFSSGALFLGEYESVCKSLKKDHEKFHGVITDPPYLMGHMRDWDTFTGAKEAVEFHKAWMAETLPLLAPGAFIASFSSGRTYHWQALAAEELGLIIHPMLTWIRTDTMPKGTDFLKQLHRREVYEWAVKIPNIDTSSVRDMVSAAVNIEWADKEGIKLPNRKNGARLLKSYEKKYGKPPLLPESYKDFSGAKYGLQTLKPAAETILCVQKPFDGKPLDSIKKHECGCMYADGARTVDGKFPSNVIVSGTDLADAKHNLGGWAKGFYVGDHDIDYLRFCVVPTASAKERDMGLAELEAKPTGGMDGRGDGSFDGHVVLRKNLSVAVKPIAVMSWLVRLLIPPNGRILDPFMGSGTTAIAAHKCGRNWVGIEKEADIYSVAETRLQYWTDNQPDLV